MGKAGRDPNVPGAYLILPIKNTVEISFAIFFCICNYDLIFIIYTMYNYNNFQKNQRSVTLGGAKNKDDASKLPDVNTKDIAQQIIQIARQNNIPIPSGNDLVDILAILEIGEDLPFEVYTIITKTITCIYEHEAKARLKKNIDV